MGQKTRRERLQRLLQLAQTYQGWNRRQLAEALGRDTTKLVPESGLPKLDLLMDLTGILDWSVEDVANYLWCDDDPSGDATENGEPGFEGLEDASKAAHRDGRYREAVEFAQKAAEAAASGEDRAIAYNREASGWDGLGRYKAALEAARRGLNEANVSNRRRLILQSNLANAYYSLWHLVEARGTAHYLLQWYDDHPPDDRLGRVVQAHAYYVRGHTYRRLMAVEPQNARESAKLALRDLRTGAKAFDDLTRDFEDDSYAGVGNTCRGGQLEAEVVLGRCTAGEALKKISEGLNTLIDPEAYPIGDWLESYGWWCIFGCNIGLRHIEDERELQRYMALFTNKADEIAERLDNWSLRERVFTMEFARRQRFADWTGVESDWTIDREDMRIITGTMGRFPMFHRTGWQILESAKVVREN